MTLGRGSRLALVSLLVGLVVLGVKFLAFYVTGSIALYSDALESIVNVATAIAALLAIWISEKPADARHPYGHFKAEYLSAVVEGVLVVLAALSILREAYAGWLQPHGIEAPWLGLVINGMATVLNGVWGMTLIRQGKRLRSPALAADGRHLLTDIKTSLGVLVGLILVTLTGWLVLDPLVAAFVALNIIWSGFGMIRESLGGLMDEAVPPETLARIERAIREKARASALQAHDLRTRHAGRMTYVDFHLVVPGEMSVSEAHEICDEVEQALMQELDEVVVSIHVEPEDKAHAQARLTF